MVNGSKGSLWRASKVIVTESYAIQKYNVCVRSTLVNWGCRDSVVHGTFPKAFMTALTLHIAIIRCVPYIQNICSSILEVYSKIESHLVVDHFISLPLCQYQNADILTNIPFDKRLAFQSIPTVQVSEVGDKGAVDNFLKCT